MAFVSSGDRRTVRIKRDAAHRRRLLAEFGYEPVRFAHEPVDIFDGEPVAVSGYGTVVRPIDGHGKVELESGEGMLLGEVPRIPVWRIEPADLRDAFERALAEGRAITIDNPTHIRATRLPADAGRRDASLRQTRPGVQQPPRR